MEFPIRINKYLAEKGYATRRGADVLIAAGRVMVNGAKATMGQKVLTSDHVEVATEAGRAQKYRYLLYHKPAGLLTHADKDSTAEDLLSYARKKNGIKGLFPVGRLDKDTAGLIVLTDDGRLTRALEAEQGYLVTVDKRVTGTFLNRLAKGVRINGTMTAPAVVASAAENDRAFTITLPAGTKHSIRRMCDALGYAVVALTRTRIGTLALRDLKPGAFHELAEKERVALYRQLKLQ